MHANNFARDAINNAKARFLMCATPYPDLSTTLTVRRDIENYVPFTRAMDKSFGSVFMDPLGYFQLKRYLYTVGENCKTSFIEDTLAYRLLRGAAKRAET